MKQRWWTSNLLLAAVASLGALLAGYGARDYLGARSKELAEANERKFRMQPVVVAQRDLEAGQRLEKDMLALRPMPMEFMPAGIVGPAGAIEVIGRVLEHDLRRGEPLQSVALSREGESSLDSLLPHGFRALTLPVDELGSQSGLVKAGDSLDIFLVREEGGRSRTDLLLEQVPVLATGSRTLDAPAQRGQSADYGTVTLLVRAEQALRVILAGKAGSLSFLLRPAGDDTPAPLRQLDSAHLFVRDGHARGIAAPQDRIELLLGGSGGPMPSRQWLQSAINALPAGG